MKSGLDRLVIILAFITLIIFLCGFAFIFLITNGIRINRFLDVSQDNLQLVQYEQVYHVFMNQEIFLKIKNNSENMIGTLIIKEKNSGIEETIHKLAPGNTINVYFALDSFFDEAYFEIVKLKYIEM